ncbi:hypothetical protein SME20J_16850 [Serratia marcescens]|nr:hypothetical protein SME20J_16850 [Serratia marcescens]
MLKARKRCDVAHGKDMAITHSGYEELKSELGERILADMWETILGGPQA